MEEAKIEGWLGLEINRDKTRVVELSQAGAELNFLGYLVSLRLGSPGKCQAVSQYDDLEEGSPGGSGSGYARE